MAMFMVDERINMEQENKRYIEIISCKKCGHSGHTASAEGIIYICSNSDHLDLNIPRIFIGKEAYPIVLREKENAVHFVPIPSWCTLPKDLAVPR